MNEKPWKAYIGIIIGIVLLVLFFIAVSVHREDLRIQNRQACIERNISGNYPQEDCD